MLARFLGGVPGSGVTSEALSGRKDSGPLGSSSGSLDGTGTSTPSRLAWPCVTDAAAVAGVLGRAGGGHAHDQDDHEARHVSQRIAAWQSEHEAQVLRRSAAKNTERREHQRRINRDKMAENMA